MPLTLKKHYLHSSNRNTIYLRHNDVLEKFRDWFENHECENLERQHGHTVAVVPACISIPRPQIEYPILNCQLQEKKNRNV